MKTNAEWRLWGEKDPLFGVASRKGREKGGAQPWSDADFYAIGEDWSAFVDRWQRYGLKRGTVAEIGCGAGRMTSRLAEEFQRVIACDVSEGMLEYAKAHVAASNIDWTLSDGATIPVADDSLDAVFSCHVLQHLDGPAQLNYFRECFRVLCPGGTTMIHIPVHTFPIPNRQFTRLARLAYQVFLTLAGLKDGIKRLRMKLGGPPFMHGVSQEIGVLHDHLVAIGFQRVEIVAFKVMSIDTIHTCVLATKN